MSIQAKRIPSCRITRYVVELRKVEKNQ